MANPLSYTEWSAQQPMGVIPTQAMYQSYLANLGAGTFGNPNASVNNSTPQYLGNATDYNANTTNSPFVVDTPNYSGTGFSPMNSNSGGIPKLPYGSLATGLIQLPFAIKAMRDANKAVLPQYALNSNMQRSIGEANAMRNQGFTTGEYNAYNQELGQDRAAAYRRGKELSGGNLSSAIGALLNGQNVDARNKLATTDAELRRRNIAISNGLNSQSQELSNLNTSLGIDQYNRKQQASAQLMQSSIGNLGSSLNLIGGFI